MAVGAETDHVYAMSVGLESLGAREMVELLGDGPFEGDRRGDVTHLAAVGAKEMVVVLGEILGELESSELVVGCDAPYEPGGLEVDEVPVSGAPGEIGETLCDVSDADGMAGAHEHLDDCAPATRVALVDPAQASLDHGVKVLAHPPG
jgi:hypothetical protein